MQWLPKRDWYFAYVQRRIEAREFQNIDILHFTLCTLARWGGDYGWANPITIFMYQLFPTVFWREAVQNATTFPFVITHSLLPYWYDKQRATRKHVYMHFIYDAFLSNTSCAQLDNSLPAILHVGTLLMYDYFSCLSPNHLRLNFDGLTLIFSQARV